VDAGDRATASPRPTAPTEPSAPDPREIAGFVAARDAVLGRIADAASGAGREPSAVRLVAVSKTVPAERIRAAVAAGLDLLGENRVQEAAAKIPAVDGARWHLIGPLQSNKARRAVELFDVIESVDSLDLARRLDRLAGEVERPGRRLVRPPTAPSEAAGIGGRLTILLQVNVDDDPAKAGFDPAELAVVLHDLLALDGLEVAGLMTVGRLVATPEAARETFRRLRELASRLRADHPGLGPELSMGMSDDYPIAVEEGATIVRVGRAIFGDRPAP
jgi:PLP dependent protein